MKSESSLIPIISKEDLTKALIDAACENNVERINDLYAQGADPNGVSSDGNRYTPLLMAANYSSPDATYRLIELGAYKNKLTRYKLTALMLAIKNVHVTVENEGYVKTIRVLLQAGVDITARDEDGISALNYAVTVGHYQSVEMLLETGAREEIKFQDQNGNTLLAKAVLNTSIKDRVKKIESLLRAGSDVHLTDSKGRTLLMRLCSSEGGEQVAALLISNGISLNALDKDGLSALSHAVQANNLAMFRLLVEAGAATDMLDIHTVIEKSNMPLIELFLEYKINLDKQDSNGCTPLMKSCEKNNLDMVRKLAGNGANPEVQDKNGRTALLLTTNLDIKLYLIIEVGVNINVVSRDGHSSIQLAMEHGHSDLVLYLLGRGLPLDVINAKPSNIAYKPSLFSRSSDTALSHATIMYAECRGNSAQAKYRKIIIELLKAGADTSITNDHVTPYRRLSNNAGHDKEIMLLLNDVNVNNHIKKAGPT